MLVVLGAFASFFSLSSTIPQVVRTLRSGSAEGVSWGSLVLSVSAMTLWCVYAVAVVDLIQVVNNTLALGLLMLLAVALLRSGGRSWVPGGIAAMSAAALAGAAAVAVVEVLNAFALAMLGTAISSVRMWPQTRLALSRVPMSGLDPSATALGWIGWLLWAAYGVGVGDYPLALCSLIGLAMQSTILAFRLPPRRTLHAVASGRLGPVLAWIVGPVSARFPLRADEFELVA